jgi:hypothetical protein
MRTRSSKIAQEEAYIMAAIANETIAVFGKGVLQAEGVVIDKEGNAWGGGRNGKVYKVSPDGKVLPVVSVKV